MHPFWKSKVTRLLLLSALGCFSLGIFFSIRSAAPPDPEDVANQIEANIIKVLAQSDQQAESIQGKIERGETNIETGRENTFEFFLIKNEELAYWTSNLYELPVGSLLDEFNLKFIKTGAGDFLVRKWKIDETRLLACLIPLQVYYKIQNEYLRPEWNKQILPSGKLALLDASALDGFPVEVNNSTLFKILPSSDAIVYGLEHISALIFLFLALGSLCMVIFQLLKALEETPFIGFLLLSAFAVAIRFTMIAFRFPAQYMESELFDPKNFASSVLNPSLGDLFFNSIAVFILCLFLFRNYYRVKGLRNALGTPLTKGVLSTFSVFCILFGMLFPFVVIQTIYNNSSFTLAISESATFGFLRIVVLISLVLSWASAFMFMHIFIGLLVRVSSRLWLILYGVLGALLFVTVNELSGQLYISSLIAGAIYISVVIGFKFYRSLQQFGFSTFAYFFLAVVTLSVTGTFATTHLTKNERAGNLSRFGSNFLIERDNFGEYLMHEAGQKIAQDGFIQARITGPFMNKEVVKQKIRQVFLPGYFSKFRTEISLFGPSGNPMDDNNPNTFSALVSQYDREATRTEYPDVYFIDNSEAEAGYRYLMITRVSRNEITLGYVVIDFALKRFIPENVYPELLIDNRFQQPFHSQNISYAVFKNGIVQSSSGEFNYDRFDRGRFGDITLYTKGLTLNGYFHVASEDSSDRIAVVSMPVFSGWQWLADFSFFLITGLTVVLIFVLAVGTAAYFSPQKLFLSARIQLILNLSFFLPLIAVSVITLGLTSRSTQEQLNAEYLSKSKSFAIELGVQLGESGDEFPEAFNNGFVQHAKSANLDANIFLPDGHLLVTTQPMIFENQLLASVIDPAAWSRIQQGERAFVSAERVGNLNYYVAYTALHGAESGKLIGVLGIPFFRSQYSLEKMQITVLSNILIIFSIVFMALLVLSFWVSRWLTYPLQMITQKLGRISLISANQPIEWNADDEIGLMVREYNQMLAKLADSKSKLERVQREQAWREIAQQVAHEIKNPLTPMKLTLQQLQRTSGAEQDHKLKGTIASLLAQVDLLDGIASSFSTFAKMPELVFERVDLNELVKNAVLIHAQSGQVKFRTELENAYVKADKQLLNRIVSNLILNGLQAEKSGTPVLVNIWLRDSGSSYKIDFSDNGTGIEPVLQEKIFQPHFSTKQSGSGLGLAIARQGMEQMSGQIGFESVVGRGTTFYISLPKA